MEEKKVEKKPVDQEKLVEIIVAIFLALTALFTAWATWIGSLHGGNQATNYTTSNNLAAEGNGAWNEASQNLMQDMLTWNAINEVSLNISFAEAYGDETEVEKYQYLLDQLMNDNMTDEFREAVEWALDQDEDVSPFDKEGYVDSYYEEAIKILDESEAKLEEGKRDNHNSDTFGLVTVFYSVILFLLGIVGTFKHLPNRKIIAGVAIVGFIATTIFMFCIPMPTGFSIASFFKAP